MKRLLQIFFLLPFALPTVAQTAPTLIPRYNYNNYNIWLNTSVAAKITKKIELYADLQLRNSDYGKAPMQYLVRPGLLYNFTDQFFVGAGYAFVITHSYGKVPSAKYTFPEHRTWQQFVFRSKIFKIELQQRARLEQRWIGETSADMEVTRYRYQHRMRYFLRANLALNRPKVEPGALYLSVSDEIMIGFGKQVGSNIYDQNRMIAGLGYHTAWGRVEISYMNQNLMQRRIWYPIAGSSGFHVIENNHTLLISYILKMDFAKKID